MADYVSIDEFKQGWTFFAKKIWGRWGKYPCSKFSCSGCEDWLDCDNQNRNSNKFEPKVYRKVELELLKAESNFKPKLKSKLGEGGQAKVFKAKFHGKDVAMKYIPLDKLKDGYIYHSPRLSYGCHEVYQQEKFDSGG